MLSIYSICTERRVENEETLNILMKNMGRKDVFTSQQNSASTILLTSVHTLSSVLVTFYQGRMSAEAADRVAAVTSSRPSTPLQTSWFEFLLDGSLLENHLQKTNPG